MVNFKKSVEKWRPIVSAKVDSKWVNLVLAIIQHESGGQAGILAHRATRYARNLPTRSGGVKRLQKAAGLMQTIPTVIESWSKKNPPGAYYEDVTGKTAKDARIQIAIGWNLIRSLFRPVGNAVPEAPREINGQLNPDFVKFLLVSYAWGIGRLRKKVKQMRAEGLEVSWKSFMARYPKLGHPNNKPIEYAAFVSSRGLGVPIDHIEDPIILDPKEMDPGSIIAVLAVVIVIGLILS